MKRLNLLIVIALLFFDFGVSHEQVNRHYERQNYASVEPISMREMCYLVLVKKINTASSALDALLKAEAYDQLYYVEFDYSSWLESAFSFSYNGYRYSGIKTTDGKVYYFDYINHLILKSWSDSPSPGTYYHNYIKKQYSLASCYPYGPN